MQVELLIIDPQIDFCDLSGALCVPGAEADTARLACMVRRLAPNSGRVVLLGDPPANNFQVSICLSERTASLKSCLADRDPRSLELIAAARAGALRAGAEYVDPAPWFCVGDRCPAVIGHYVSRRDLAHVTVEYALHLTPALDRQLDLGRGS